MGITVCNDQPVEFFYKSSSMFVNDFALAFIIYSLGPYQEKLMVHLKYMQIWLETESAHSIIKY